MITSIIEVVIDPRQNPEGNLLVLSDKNHLGQDMSDSIQSLNFRNIVNESKRSFLELGIQFSDKKTNIHRGKDRACRPMPLGGLPYRNLSLKRSEKVLSIDYDTMTGNYYVQENSFDESEIQKIVIEVNRQNLNMQISPHVVRA